jgi:hypothetical protein
VQTPSFEAVEDFADLLIFDDILPTGFSPFRTLEYSHYLSFFNGKLVSLEGWHLWVSNESFSTALQQLPLDPDLKKRIVPFSLGAGAIGRLAYVTFLANAASLVPYFEGRQLPFIFQLYPGGGFQIGQAESDEKLRRVVLSDYCRKVIVTQRLSRDYIVDRIGCDPAKIDLIFGGVFESRGDFDFHQEKKIFGRDKHTLDICFVAHKYGNDLVSKGYEQFARIAISLSRDDPRLRFHVVGDYSAADIALGEAEEKFTFYGRRESNFFTDFYPAMDAIISINRPFVLAPGAFDGFPTGACIEAGFHGVLNCINDPLELNPVLVPGQDFLLLDFDEERSIARLRQLLDCPEELYRLAYGNWRKFRVVFGTDTQLWARTRLIASELSCQVNIVAPSSPSVLPTRSRQSELARNGRQTELDRECRRLVAAYQILEGHYLAVEGERKRLEQYIRSQENVSLCRQFFLAEL